jgi:hypothetical protein
MPTTQSEELRTAREQLERAAIKPNKRMILFGRKSKS